MLTFSHHPSGILEVACNERTLLEYHYLNADVFAEEVPKPYFHPLRTLGGSVVTLCRPNDHPWHKGVGMTLTKVGATNFWGGVTYQKEKGYHWVANHGRQRHLEWTSGTASGQHAEFAHVVAWEKAEGDVLLREERRFGIVSHPNEGFWTLDLGSRLTNTTAAELVLGTYESSEQLAGSFYTGLFWRIPREFLDRIHTLKYHAEGKVFCAAQPADEKQVHGTPGRWVALHGSVDGVVEPVTIALIDLSAPNQSQPRIFYRRNQVGLALPFQGPEDRRLAPGETLELRYRLLLADGHWQPDRLKAYCEEQTR